MPENALIHQILDAFEPAHLAKDLIFIAIWMIAAICCIYVPFLNHSFLRVIFALPMILFIPGYVLIATLFPSKEDLDDIERLALSFGLSIAIVPLIGLILNYTPWGVRLDPIVISLVAFTTVMILLAQYRRSLLPQEQRFEVPLKEMFNTIRADLYRSGQSRNDKIFSTILILAIIAAVGTTIYVIVVPKEGEKFTEFYILGPGGLAEILATLDKAQINVEYMYAFVQHSGDNAVIIFRFDEVDKAIQVLLNADVRILTGEEVYAL